MEIPVVTGTITVVKADGPGWLIIAETVDEGRYRMIRELYGEEPVTDEILAFLNRLPGRLAAVEGAEVELKDNLDNQRRISPKRAARQAAREVAEARDPGKFQPTKAMRFKSAEIEATKAFEPQNREVELKVWVRYGKKRCAVLEEKHDGLTVVEITGSPSDVESNRMVAVTLARHFKVPESRVELLHGYANPRKSYRVTLPFSSFE
ncbi:MAG TPA: DUF167 family protein [Chloroflexia bacterium]|nr:DUF167 family protein [Chloroflexia bacterium]